MNVCVKSLESSELPSQLFLSYLKDILLWSLFYPAALKNFFELCSIFNVTFKSDNKTCYGNCKAEKLLYITTRGMDISTYDPFEQATPYLKALSWLCRIGPMDVISA